MSHMVEIIDGRAQIAWANQMPWHGLGTKVEPTLTPQEMMEVARLDWEVEKHPVYFDVGDGVSRKARDKQALVRSSDNKFLDIVSETWIPVQNADVFEFFTEYVTVGGMTMEVAGSLKDGQIIFGLAKVNDAFDLFGGRDVVDSYLLFSNPHQFGRSVDVRFTPIRVVCNNTLTLSLNSTTKNGIALNHRSEFDIEKVKATLEEASQKMRSYHDMAQFLSSKRYTQQSLFEYFNRVFPKTTNKAKGVSFEDMMKSIKEGDRDTHTSRNAKLAMDIIHEQPGAELGEGSWWSAYNATTFMTNHVLGRNEDSRMQSLWFGANKDLNINSLAMAVEYADAA